MSVPPCVHCDRVFLKMQALVSHIQHVHGDEVERDRGDTVASELNDGGGYEGGDGAGDVTDSDSSDVPSSSSSSSSSSRDSDPSSAASGSSTGGRGSGSSGGSDGESEESSGSNPSEGDQDLMPGPLDPHDRSADDDDANSSEGCVYSVDEDAFPDTDKRVTR